VLAAHHGQGGAIRLALGRDWKGKLSLLGYVFGMVLAAAWQPMAGFVVFVGVAMVWAIPDSRMAAVASNRSESGPSASSTQLPPSC
jgi:hypothetical protein